jgi:hypothetical protein
VSVSEFWDLTPRELFYIAEAHREKMQVEREQRLVQAYQTAVFYRARKLPSLRRLLERMRAAEHGPERAQTSEQMLAFAKRYMANLERLEGKE